MSARRKLSENVALLFDFAVMHSETGFTQPEAAAALGVDVRQMPRFINALRKEFGESDINLIADPDGTNKWIYRLTGRPEDARAWNSNRVGDMESRLTTMKAVAHSLTNSTDGRSLEGRKARIIDRSLGRLIEDLAVLRQDASI